jgi:hypothetical protein
MFSGIHSRRRFSLTDQCYVPNKCVIPFGANAPSHHPHVATNGNVTSTNKCLLAPHNTLSTGSCGTASETNQHVAYLHHTIPLCKIPTSIVIKLPAFKKGNGNGVDGSLSIYTYVMINSIHVSKMISTILISFGKNKCTNPICINIVLKQISMASR